MKSDNRTPEQTLSILIYNSEYLIFKILPALIV